MKEIPIVSPTDFVFNTPLYQWVQADKDFLEKFCPDCEEYLFDGYNPDGEKETTYIVKDGYGIHKVTWEDYEINQTEFTPVLMECRRTGNHMIITIKNDFENGKVMKVGQSPSIASIHIGQIQQYKKIMSKEDLKEFTRAIGLVANGVGIGSFVYLRRIFERLILETADKMIAEGTINKDVYERSRMDEKIAMLKSELPEFLVENKAVYGIVSTGIHMLSEEECLEIFDVMRASIELILDAKKEKIEREQKQKETIAKIAKLKSALK